MLQRSGVFNSKYSLRQCLAWLKTATENGGDGLEGAGRTQAAARRIPSPSTG